MPSAPFPVVGRSLVASPRGVVAASQPLAALAGVAMLERGGSAVDAAIATNAALGVLEPTGNGLGGDLFALVHEAQTDMPVGLNASGWAPAALSIARLAALGVRDAMPSRGPHVVTVPGVVAGWAALHDRFGRLDFAGLLEPAIGYAERGVPLGEVTARIWAEQASFLAGHPEAAATFLAHDRAPRAGEVFRNRALATSLRRIARDGRDGFYRGPTAESIVAAVRAAGGVMEAADLEEFDAEWVTPLATRYRGWTVYELPPNGQGIAALVMLGVMRHFPLDELGFLDARAMHVMIEAKKLAYADLIRYVGDPRVADVPVSELLDDRLAAERASRIDPARAADTVLPSSLRRLASAPGGDTVYLAAADARGTIVSLIQSNYQGFGCGIVPEGTGFMLQNRGALWSLDPASPNALAPRKRPLHTIIPAFMRRGDVRIGFGIMGGWNQAQAHAQFVSHVADHGLTIQQALEAGRFTKPTFEGRDVKIESLVPEATRAALAALGHDVEVVPPRSTEFGFGQAVMVGESGVAFGASEPRHDGAAVPCPP